jgi:hypothetical protein
VGADGAWSRWIFPFVKHPRHLLPRVCSALRRGGVVVVHEYVNYATWRVPPGSPDLEELMRVVMRAGVLAGGEQDIGLDLPLCHVELGFETQCLR